MKPVIASVTIEAYRRTDYVVFTEAGDVVLRIDKRSDAVRELHAAHGVACSAFVTAWNPFGVPARHEDNVAALATLKRRLGETGVGWLDGEGRGDDPRWAPEPSVLAFGVDAGQARGLAIAFDQNAVVVVAADGVARLLLHPAATLADGSGSATQ